MTERVFVGLGSNIDPRRWIPRAVTLMRERFGPLEISRVYESEAVGFVGDPFLNLVAGFDCAGDAAALVASLREIEDRCRRDRGAARYGPRTLDADLLLFGERVIRADGLVLPHPDITRYAFVLRPLAEIAGARRHPVSGRRIADFWRERPTLDQRVQPADFDPCGVPDLAGAPVLPASAARRTADADGST